jgi:hypothetical protein
LVVLKIQTRKLKKQTTILNPLNQQQWINPAERSVPTTGNTARGLVHLSSTRAQDWSLPVSPWYATR